MMNPLRKFHALLSRLPIGGITGLCLAMVLVFGVIDHATGRDLSFSIFYVLPVTAACWYGNKRQGVAVALISAAVWLMVDLNSGHAYSYAIVPFWNAAVRLGFFAIILNLLAALRRLLRREEAAARMDTLTAVWNTRGFMDNAQGLWALAQRHQHTTAVAYVDLDNFKAVNDARGHAEGDAVLRDVAGAMVRSVRTSDVVGRLGGDEFAILLPETSCDGAACVITKLRGEILRLAEAREWPITPSIGVVVLCAPYPTLQEALKLADGLMYRVKQGGKNSMLIEPFQVTSDLSFKAMATASL